MYSQLLIDAINAESAQRGLKSPTAIATAIRLQLSESRGGDTRVRDYYVAARVVYKGVGYALPGWVKITGLSQLSTTAQLAQQHCGKGSALASDCAKAYTGGARVSLSRAGEAHVVVMLPECDPAKPDAWVDLYVLKTSAEADAKLATIAVGKLF